MSQQTSQSAGFLKLFHSLRRLIPGSSPQQRTKQFISLPQRPSTNDRAVWYSHWNELGQPWRWEPEIDTQRQAYLIARLAITPDVMQGIYPFKDVQLNRADIEWLLATHEGGCGPVTKDEDEYWLRKPLDLRGADLRNADLRGLPLTRVLAGLTGNDRHAGWIAPEIEEAAMAHLEGADLVGAHLEDAGFGGAYMEGINLGGAHLGRAFLRRAHLAGACLDGANLQGSDLMEAHLEKASLNWAHLEDANLGRTNLEKATLAQTYLNKAFVTMACLQGADLHEGHLQGAILREAHLEGANLTRAHLEEANLAGAHLQGVQLPGASLTRATLDGAYLEQADLSGAQMQEAWFNEAHLEGAFLHGVHAEGAHFYQAHLERTGIQSAHLERADLSRTSLAGASLMGTHLEGADLRHTHLEGKTICSEDLQRIRTWDREGFAPFPETLEAADLRRVFFDASTQLDGCMFGTRTGAAMVGNVSWKDVNLTVVDWSNVRVLGDERMARHMLRHWKRNRATKKLTGEDAQLHEYQVFMQLLDAVRANRQLALALQEQGMNEEAAHFAYQAQVLQRKVLLWQAVGQQINLPTSGLQQPVSWWRRMLRFGDAVFSWFLATLAGYGYKPQRSLVAYVLVIAGFTMVYYVLGQVVGPPLSPIGALVFSVTSFHGRGFFPGGIRLDDPITVLAAFEAVVGLAIEVSLIATFTQRFFGK